MKKCILTLVIISIVVFAQGQTLKETQDWLKQKIESYGSTSNFINTTAKMYITDKIQDFDFVNNEVIINENEDITITSGNIRCSITKKYNARLPFNKIISIEVQENGIEIKTNGNQIVLQTKFTDKICSSEEANQLLPTLSDNTSKISSFYIGIDFSKEDNLSERFQKAINRLLTFIPKQKEAF